MGSISRFRSRSHGRACLACLGATCAVVALGFLALAAVLWFKVRAYVSPKVKAESATSASFPARGVKTIRLDVKVGSIRVEPGTGDQITVGTRRHAGGPTKEAVNRYLTLSQVKLTNTDGTLEIVDVPADEHADDITRLANRGLDVIVRVPTATEIEATTGVGSVTISGPVRDLSAESGVGTITLDDLQPQGDSVRAHAGTGSIKAAARALPRRSLTADTGVGSVELTIPAESRATVHLSSGVGSVASDFPLNRPARGAGEVGGRADGDVNGGGIEIRATAGTGSISLRRAGP